MTHMEFSFAPPKEPPPIYTPNFQAFHDTTESDFPEKNGKVQIPDNAGSILLEFFEKGNWIAVDEALSELERAWRQEEGHAGVRAAVNFQDPETGTVAIIIATREAKPDFVERLASLGADANIHDNDASTALHYAALSMKEDMVKLLISSGADCTIPGGSLHRLPLHLACLRRHGAFPVVRYLALLSGEDSRLVKDKEGNLPLWLAAERSHMHVVKELLQEQGIEQLTYHNKEANGDTVMHAVIRRRQTDFLEVFLDAGAPVNAQNDEGQTLLHVAVLTSNEPAITLLHSHNADVQIIDKYDRTPLHLAVEKGLEKVVDILTEKYPGSIHFRAKDGSTLAHIAALSGHPETVLALLRRGVYLHMPNKAGALALHAAARTGHAAVVRALLSRGSKVDTKTRDNYTALHLAIEYGKPNVVQVLLGAGASVHTRGGKNGETPLHIAARVPNGDLATSMLLKCGANVNTPMENGETALHVASRAGSMMMVELLLREGANPVAVSLTGETPFHVAVRVCHYDIAKALIEFIVGNWGRQDAVNVVNMANSGGETALHFVAEILPEMTHENHEDLSLVNLVLDYDAGAGTQTKLTLETPLHYCARSGNQRVLSALLKGWGHMKTQAVINRQSNAGWTPLLTACEGGQFGVVKILLKNHARVDIFDDMGKAALHIAVENGHADIVDILLRSRAFVNAKTKAGITALHLAAMKGWPDIVRLLVEKYEAPVDSYTTNLKSPLHLAAQYGKLDICDMLVKMGANPNATDDHGQNPLHIAAEYDNEEVVQLFLKVLADKNPLTIADMRGNTIAHIAAKNGSIAVMELLLQFNKEDIINSKIRGNDATVLQVAAAGGHVELVKMLIAAGASTSVENSDGLTAFHLAAKSGHLGVIEVLREVFSPKTSSLKNGLTGLHLAAYYGQADAAREILTTVPATIRSDDPTVSTSTGSEIGAEAGLTPLHVACKSGQEAIVRMMLNYPGVQVDVPSDRLKYLPLHMAALNGHSSIVGLLLSRAGDQLNVPDAKGQTPLMVAATKGHQNMASLLITQGADLEAVDKNGWTALHCSAVAGQPEIVKILCSSGADTTAESTDKKIALVYAAHAASSGRKPNSGHLKVMTYLMQQEYDCFALLNDRVFLMDLMLCAKNNDQKPIKEFIEFSPSPVELALKLGKFYRDTADVDKYHAKDCVKASRFCQQAAGKLLTIACIRFQTSDLLRAIDKNDTSLLDLLVIGAHKEAVALLPVQQYLSTVFLGGLNLTSWLMSLSFVLFFLCPPLWFIFSLPLPHHISEVPFLKLVVHITSHLYYIILMVLVFMSPFQHLYERHSLLPKPEEWLLLFWIIGNFVAEVTSHEERRGLGILRSVVLAFSCVAIALHIASALTEHDTKITLLYIRCQFLATACFCADIQMLSYLSFHQLFGPFGVMLTDIVSDFLRFFVFFLIFVFGFSFSLSATYEDVHPSKVNFKGGLVMDMVSDPFASFQTLYWSVFGLIDPADKTQLKHPLNGPTFANDLTRFVFAIYLAATMIVLINLLIAMLSDTYQRIKARSDLEWKFIRAKIIINLEKTPISPSPLNTFILAGTALFKLVLVIMEKRALGKVYSEDSVATEYSKIHGWRKSIVADISGSRASFEPPFSKMNPVQQLADVVPWSDIVEAGEDFDYGLAMDDFDE